MTRLLTARYVDANDGAAFVPVDEFIRCHDAYRKAWLAYHNLPDDPARQPERSESAHMQDLACESKAGNADPM